MWVLLLPLGLGAALAARGRGDPSLGCGLCHSPHRARAQANATLGATVTLGCPAAGVPLGRLRAERWYFWGDTAGDAVTVCSQNRGHPRCQPPYGDRAALVSPPGPPENPRPPETPRGLLLRGLRDGDAGTYSCLLLGDDDCACGEVTLRLGEVTLRGALWEATRVLMLLSVLAATAGLALGVSVAAGTARRVRARVAGVTLLLAGLLALLALAVYTVGTLSLLGPARPAWRFSWSYILGWVAVVLTSSAELSLA
ncbi:uncharacterized protein LOC135576593 isoform X2 [Columba livia]|uniref:uncharacterized protein LOC135576593 isoform X2 n=1 Tax=Columba livia TaxID=8932 RepID=UPI0031BAB27F